jgi:hypothetical protein
MAKSGKKMVCPFGCMTEGPEPEPVEVREGTECPSCHVFIPHGSASSVCHIKPSRYQQGYRSSSMSKPVPATALV